MAPQNRIVNYRAIREEVIFRDNIAAELPRRPVAGPGGASCVEPVGCSQASSLAGRQVRSVSRRPKPKRLTPSALHSSATFRPRREAPSGPQWLHDLKLDGFRMAARIDNGRAQLLTRTGLDWTDNIPAPSRLLREHQLFGFLTTEAKAKLRRSTPLLSDVFRVKRKSVVEADGARAVETRLNDHG
jgi:hypothetical protein